MVEAVAEPVTQASTETVSAAAAPPTEAATPDYHVVKAGDTIISIAMRYDLGWQELLDLNNLSENSILHLDQKVRIR